MTHASDTASGRVTELTLSISVVNYTNTFPDFEKPLHSQYVAVEHFVEFRFVGTSFSVSELIICK